MTDPLTKSPTTQEYVANLIGLFTHLRGSHFDWPTALIVRVLAEIPISEASVRVTLHRMVQRGLLATIKTGRSVAYRPTPNGNLLLGRGRERIFAPEPFGAAHEGWTLLHAPTKPALELLRREMQNRLLWAGFGIVEPRLWLAPGRVDMAELLGDLQLESVLEELNIFHGNIAPPARLDRLICGAWDTARIAFQHKDFSATWNNLNPGTPALPTLLRMLQAWTSLLLSDPGLPASELGGCWSSADSSRLFHRVFEALWPDAQRDFDSLVSRSRFRIPTH